MRPSSSETEANAHGGRKREEQWWGRHWRRTLWTRGVTLLPLAFSISTDLEAGRWGVVWGVSEWG